MTLIAGGISARLRYGVRWGLILATICSAWVALTYGAAEQRKYHLSLPQLVGLYYASGAIGGVVFGACVPLARNIFGAVVVGVLVALPVGFMVTASVVPGVSWTSNKFLVVWLVGAMTMGPIGALIGWRYGRRGQGS